MKKTTAPEGVMADAFYSKGQKKPSELFQIVAEVIQRTDRHEDERTLVWARQINTDISGTSFALITCTECLRPFIVVTPREDIASCPRSALRFLQIRNSVHLRRA